MMKLSFILPVYNVEDYLSHCLDSILSQMQEGCEIILVDDGSKDGSGALCDQYASRYETVKVIHKENEGPSSARNTAMEYASGRYICFADSDDYILPGTVDKLLAWIDAADADICFLQSMKVFPDGSSEPLGEGITAGDVRGKTMQQVLTFLSQCPKFSGSAWGKLFRREFLEEKAIRFPGDRRLSEDLIYCLQAFTAAESFDALEFPFYCYRQNRAGSITNLVSTKYYFDTALFVTETAETYCVNKEPVDEIARCAMSFAAYEYAILLGLTPSLGAEDLSRAYACLEEYRWVLRYGGAAKTKLVRAVVSILGVRLAAKLLHLYLNNR